MSLIISGKALEEDMAMIQSLGVMRNATPAPVIAEAAGAPKKGDIVYELGTVGIIEKLSGKYAFVDVGNGHTFSQTPVSMLDQPREMNAQDTYALQGNSGLKTKLQMMIYKRAKPTVWTFNPNL